MIYGDAPLEAAVAQRIASSMMLRERVTLVGAVPHDQIGAWFSAADVFVSGSHHEGSGYSLIEAMACGAAPCVTSIPSFRALTGGHGALWRAGDADACAAALVDVASRDRAPETRGDSGPLRECVELGAHRPAHRAATIVRSSRHGEIGWRIEDRQSS
jgi:glycosyltransferase involved in cell wall biosynthesis